MRVPTTVCFITLFLGWGASETMAQSYGLPTPVPFPSTDYGAPIGDINDAGEIAGFALVTLGVGREPLFWASPTSTPTLLSSGGYPDTNANGINDASQVVGFGQPGFYLPLFWASPTSTPTSLPLGDYGNAQAIGINNAGQIVGLSQHLGSWIGLFWASRTTLPTPLPAGAFTESQGMGINDAGQITGIGVIGGTSVALYWASPTSGPTPLPAGGYTESLGMGINDAGQITGIGVTAGASVALYWASPTSSPISLPGDANARGIGINNRGQITGYIGGTYFPLVWEPTDLDGDGIANDVDNCPTTPNPLQEDLDGDGTGDDCDTDDDGDNIPDETDNCPLAANPFQEDVDRDGLGNACDGAFTVSTVVEFIEQDTADSVSIITTANPPGANGMIAKLTGKGGVVQKVSNAVNAHEAGTIDTATYLFRLLGALDVLTAYDNQLAAKVANGQIAQPSASLLQALGLDIRLLINELIDAT